MKTGDWIMPAGAVSLHLVESTPEPRPNTLPQVGVKCGRVFYSEYCQVVDLAVSKIRRCGKCEKFSVKKG